MVASLTGEANLMVILASPSLSLGLEDPLIAAWAAVLHLRTSDRGVGRLELTRPDSGVLSLVADTAEHIVLLVTLLAVQLTFVFGSVGA